VFCIFIDVFIWSTIIAEKPATTAKLDFLNVGQGDATLLQTTEGVLFLTDSGPNGQKTIRALSSILPKTKNYIDILIISHPQLDHFGGFVEIIKQYKAGAVIYNGRDAETGNETWNQLLSEIEKKKNSIDNSRKRGLHKNRKNEYSIHLS
jgi:competence protein ComEC